MPTFDVQETPNFTRWLNELADERARKRIVQRTIRLRSGLFGDAKFFGSIGELRVDYGPGYRVYFVRRGKAVIVLLCGGDKSSQRAISRALES
jgi:putative addiction module killer protein